MTITRDAANPGGATVVGQWLIFDINVVPPVGTPYGGFQWTVAGDPATFAPLGFIYPPAAPFAACLPATFAAAPPMFLYGTTAAGPAGCTAAAPPTAFMGTVVKVIMKCVAPGAGQLVLEGPEAIAPSGTATTVGPPLSPMIGTEIGPLPQVPAVFPGPPNAPLGFVGAAAYTCLSAVGGVGEQPDLAALPSQDSSASGDQRATYALAGLAAAVLAVVGAGAFVTLRRRRVNVD